MERICKFHTAASEPRNLICGADVLITVPHCCHRKFQCYTNKHANIHLSANQAFKKTKNKKHLIELVCSECSLSMPVTYCRDLRGCGTAFDLSLALFNPTLAIFKQCWMSTNSSLCFSLMGKDFQHIFPNYWLQKGWKWKDKYLDVTVEELMCKSKIDNVFETEAFFWMFLRNRSCFFWVFFFYTRSKKVLPWLDIDLII